MEISQTGIDLIKKWESCRLKAYQDIKGIWTIGWGHTKDVTEGQEITQEQADKWLLEDTAAAQQDVDRMVKAPLTQNQYDALVSLFYNLGASQLRHSNFVAFLNAESYLRVAYEWPTWCHSSGGINKGLLKRRLMEALLFLDD